MSKTALLILDMLNTFDFPEGQTLARRALPAAKNLAQFKKRCLAARVPVIYVNDNFGEWHSDWKKIYQVCTEPRCRGRQIAELLKPAEQDHFVLKPKHSGFYQTSLEPLLKDLKVKRLILTGIAGDICVLFTAHDAHMREFEISVLKDCVASNTVKGDRFLEYQLTQTMKLPVSTSKNVKLS